MLNLNAVMIGTSQPDELAAFYGRVLDHTAEWSDPEHGMYGWKISGTYLVILEHSEMTGSAKEPGRLMLNFETTDVQGEFGRMTAAGAEAIREPYEMGGGWVATLADPDGNYFQLVTPMPM